MLSISSGLIASRYIAESMTTNAGHFGHLGLCQLHTVSATYLYAVDKGLCDATLLHQLIDSAMYMYLLTFSSPDITQATLLLLSLTGTLERNE